MKAGTLKSPKYIQSMTIKENKPVIRWIVCWPVSLAGHLKTTEWKIFQSFSDFLLQLGTGELSEEITKAAEKFICPIYKAPDVETCDEACVQLFYKGLSQESLPPTSDAVHLHIKGAHYQIKVWKQSSLPIQQLPGVSKLSYMSFISQ